jgi:hypothetical protein
MGLSNARGMGQILFANSAVGSCFCVPFSFFRRPQRPLAEKKEKCLHIV